MNPKLNALIEKIDNYSLRERVLLLICALAVLVGIWQLALEMPQERKRAQLNEQLDKVAAAQQAQTAQIAALSSALGESTQDELLAERAALQERLSALDEDLAALSHGLVSADQLPEILQDVLVSTTRLQLLRMSTLPVEELLLNEAAQSEAASTDGVADATGVFKHSVALKVSGTYFEVVAFLQSLETLPWRFYWDGLEYRVADYPRAEIDIRVYTLSAEEGLLGV